MPLSRANVETGLVNDWNFLLVRAGMSLFMDGTNPNLNWPIGKAMLYLGVSPADIANVSDMDVARVPTSKTLFFLALADVYTAEAILGQVLARVDTQVGINRKSWEQMATGLEKAIERLWAQINSRFVQGRAPVLSGKMAPDPQPPDAVCVPWIAGP